MAMTASPSSIGFAGNAGEESDLMHSSEWQAQAGKNAEDEGNMNEKQVQKLMTGE